MRRTIALLLALAMAFSLAVPALAADELPPAGEVDGWQDDTDMNGDDGAFYPPVDVTPVPTETPAATPEPEQTAAPVPEATDTPAPVATTEPTAEPVPTDDPEATQDPALEPSPSPEASAEPSPSAEPDTDEEIMLLSLGDSTKGQVDVTVSAVLDMGGYPTFTASLSSEAGYMSKPQSVTVNGGAVSFEDLEAGTYTLTVTGQYLVGYEQIIDVGESDGVRVLLTLGQLAGYDESKPHPGVLRYGDLDGDHEVDAGDWTLLAGMLDSGGQTYDLNGDKTTDLADAQLLAKAMKVSPMTATPEHYVPLSAIRTTTDAAVAGNIDDLFKDNGNVYTLGNDDGVSLSQEPVELSFAVPDGAQTDAIVLERTNITAGVITVETDDGAVAYAIGGGAAPIMNGPASDMPAVASLGQDMADVPMAIAAADPVAAPAAGEPVQRDASGNIVLNLGTKKAVKKVTIKITDTVDQGSLASITQVEFVNGMENRIPEPQMDVPQNVATVAGSRQFTVSWSACQNITGYEVEITANGVTDVFPLTGTCLTVTNFNKDEVVNYTTYTVRVQSVNGAWSSGWSNGVAVTPVPSGRPDKPDNVKAVGGCGEITVSWKAMKDTVGYYLYYKAENAAEYTMVDVGSASSYKLSGLDGSRTVKYDFYVVGWNEKGESAPSLHAAATTVVLDPPQMPQFRLINRSDSGVPGPYHITSAILPNASGVIVGSEADAAGGTAWATVDGDPASFYERGTWDDGGYNDLSNTVGLIYTFDKAYKMDTIGMMSVDPNMDYTYVKLRWWDSTGTEHAIGRDDMRSERRYDSAGRSYFFLRLPEPVEAAKVQIGVARYWTGNKRVAVSEVYFYEYDPLRDDIMGLYADDLHISLREDVTREELDALRARIDGTDAFGHPHPDKAWLLSEWETAEKIFQDQFMGRTIRVHTGITASGDEHGFSGLNAWQPLGVTAARGDKLTVYVGGNGRKTGEKTPLQLVFTQYHAEASALSATVKEPLVIGANEITVPMVSSTSGVESGGAVYVQYTGGANASGEYVVRVSGGVQVPVLDLYKVPRGEWAGKVSAYLAELQTYSANMEATHNAAHQGSETANSYVNYAYDEQNCILGATDIMLDTMMLSLPVKQVLAGCGGDAGTLLASLNAMEDMMGLFYQHKGLNASAADAVDRIPQRHLNIRYQRMFSGAFMYASGDHIGIEWNETAGMASCGGVQADGSGLWQGGNYFGWGVAHEIGHNINQNCYAIAEITNNYFAVLAQSKETNASVRFDYSNVYAKVTSGAKGSASNVFTQLAMYWQLHLAYDKGLNFKTYDTYEEQLANLFFARVDTYARTPSKAPAPGGVALTLEKSDVEQNIMRLACAAAQKDLLDFFQRWGKTPDAATVQYASQFEKETRAIYYVNDEARLYTLAGGASSLAADGSTAAIASVTAEADPDQANKVNITIKPNGAVPANDILGYEIVRCTIEKGVTTKRTVGFTTTTTTFADVVSAMNNRAVSYEVTMVDKYLNRSAVATAGMVKIEHKGDLAKDNWTIATKGLTADPIVSGGQSMDDPEPIKQDPAALAIDGDRTTVYTAKMDAAAIIEIDFHEKQVVTGMRYSAGGRTPVGLTRISVRQNGNWLQVAEAELDGDKTVWFSNGDGRYVSTYETDALQLALVSGQSGSVSVAEVDVLGPTGDNVDFTAVGYLAEAFQYGETDDDFIPAGSLVFTGTYAGNAAYNTVLLYDQDGQIVTGAAGDGSRMAYQTIYADVPDGEDITDVRDGVWIYWIDPGDLTTGFVMPQKVRVELYRVNDAHTNEGERLVSDSLLTDVPAEPGKITLSADGAVQAPRA